MGPSRFLKRYQTPIVTATAVLLPLLVYRANAVRPADANTLDKIILLATSPLKRLMTWATSSVSDTWFSYVDVVGARQENAELRRRLDRLEHERDELLTLGIMNRHLSALLDLREQNPKMELRTASVIGAGGSPMARTLEIDRGAMDGIRRGMPVVAGQGLVGLVQRVAWNTAEVMLIADEKVSVHAVVVRSRARGRVRGRGLWPGFALSMSELLRTDDVEVGDRIATSGLGGILPAGLPLGEVTSVRTDAVAQQRLAELAPYVDFARLEHVSVLVYMPEAATIATPEPLRPPALRSNPPPAETPDAGTGDAGPEDGGGGA